MTAAANRGEACTAEQIVNLIRAAHNERYSITAGEAIELIEQYAAVVAETQGKRLYNCCTDGLAPDWSQFKSLYVGGCITETSGDDSWTSPEPFETADFFTVYARHHSGEAEAITDVSDRADVSAIASQLSEISGLVLLGPVPVPVPSPSSAERRG